MVKHKEVPTDNYSIADKVMLRRKATAHLQELNVLDCFAGNNILWGKFKCNLYYGIENNKGKGVKNLYADNLKVIPALDLSRFNVIDLDSYCIPCKQLVALWGNSSLRPGTVIIYTAIFGAVNQQPKVVLEHFGLSEICSKTTLIIARYSAELFYGFLYDMGIRKVYKYTTLMGHQNKQYGYFVVPGAAGSDDVHSDNA